MARISAAEAGGQNVVAVLDTIAWAEGTSTSRFTKDDGYDVVVGGVNSPNTFSDYSAHPNILVKVNSKGLNSTAAGRYQELNRYAVAYMAELKLKDFSPISQDRIAIRRISERKALQDVKDGRFDAAIRKVAPYWASLPGAGHGQPEKKLEDLRRVFVSKGGRLA